MASKGQAVFGHSQGRVSDNSISTVVLSSLLYLQEIPQLQLIASGCHTVPSNKRASEVERYSVRAEANEMLEDAEDDGWVAPPATQYTHEAEEIPSTQPQPAMPSSSKGNVTTDKSEDDIPDIDDLELEDGEAEEDEVRKV